MTETVNRVLRDHNRYTGDGLQPAVTGAPLPVGDPSSGVYTPSKADLRAAFESTVVDSAAAGAGYAAAASGFADAAAAAADRVDLGDLDAAVVASTAAAATATAQAGTATAQAAAAAAEATRASQQSMADPSGIPPRAKDVMAVARKLGGTAIDFVGAQAWAVDPDAALPSITRPESLGTFARASTAFVWGRSRLLSSLASGAMPYAFDPATGAALGYYPARGDTALTVLNLTNAAWTKLNLTATSGAMGGAGAASGYTLADSATNGTHSITDSSIAVTTGTPYYLTTIVAAGTVQNCRMQVTGNSGSVFMDIDLLSGVVSSISGCSQIETVALPFGLMQIGLTYTPNASPNSIRVSMYDLGAVSYAGGSGTILCSHPILSKDFQRMPYPDATRAADVFTVDLTSVPWSNSTGSLTARAKAAPQSGLSHKLFEIRNAGTDAYLRVDALGGAIRLVSAAGTLTAAGQNSGDVVVGLRWDADWIEFYVNGAPFGRLANALAAIDPDEITIGSDNTGSNWDAPITSVYFGAAWLDFADLYDVSEMRLNGRVVVTGATPSRAVGIATATGVFPLTHGDGDNYDPIFDAALREIRWACDYKGATLTKRFALDMSSSLDPANTDLRLILEDGQSRRVGVQGLPIITGVVDADRAAMFSPGARVMASAYPAKINTLVSVASLARMVPLTATAQGSSGEASGPRLVEDWLGLAASSGENVLSFNVAIGSSSIEEHSIGSEPWANASACIARAAYFAWRTGCRMKALAAFWDQGDANAANTVTAYRDALWSYYDDLNDRWQAYRDWDVSRGNADPGDCAMYLTQFNVSTATNAVPEAYAAAIADDTMSRALVISTPSYIFPVTALPGDNHYSNIGMARRGCFEARMLDAYSADVDAGALRMVSASRAGAVITVALNTAAPNLTMPVVIDATLVSNNADGKYGIRVDGITNGATISTVTVNGSNQIVITLSATPTGTLSVTAGLNPESTNNQGPMVQSCRTNFRDSATGDDVILGTNYPRHNWLCAGRVAVA